METILIVEDKDSMARMLRETIESAGYKAVIAQDGDEGIARIRKEKISLVLSDLKLPGKDGLQVLAAAREEDPAMPVIVMTAYGSVDTAVRAIKEGAFDFITKPFDTDHLLHLIKKALENQRLLTENMLLKEEAGSAFTMPQIIGKGNAITDVAKSLQKVAPAKTTVLLFGESGTGKELFARAIHYLSPRRNFPFVAINCAAIPKDLLESELFGYEKGAFTGAETRKPGRFELADRGSIFLDEIAEMDPSLQAKIMRVIQEGEIEHIGGLKTIPVDVRIIAATNRNIEQAVSDGRFREDLYYRLNVFPVSIPPLRERPEDIPLLADFFVKKYCSELKTAAKTIPKETMDMLVGHPWKGNVRELKNTIERAVILTEGSTITQETIFLNPLQAGSALNLITSDGSLGKTAKEAVRIVETQRIKKALAETKGNKSRAAEILKVSYKTLLTKIKDYGIA